MSQDAAAVCVSVVIPAFNAQATIGKTLEALSKQNCFQPFEVIVVDDGSLDQTPQVVAGFPSVKYLRQDNAGPAAARNYGARMAQGDYVAFTDSDCIPHPDWISLALKGFAQKSVGAVAGSYGIANPSSWLARCVHAEILWRHTHLMPDFPKSFGSYNFCVKKEIFQAIGGFNTQYRRASGEDNDLSYKILKAGWRIFFERQALVDHHHPTSVKKYLKEQFQHGYWRVLMYKDHPSMMAGDGYTFWKDVVEMPWAAVWILALLLSVVGYMPWFFFFSFICFPLLGFEIFCAWAASQEFFEGILYGFVLFFRALFRFFGLSTGIFAFLFQKKRENILNIP